MSTPDPAGDGRVTATAYAIPLDDDEPDEKTEFTFAELDDRGKERAREWFRQDYPDHDWWDSVYDDTDKIADMLGITIARKSVRLMGGGTRQELAIYFSGFCSQGDGACFEGDWHPHKCPILILDKVLTHAPQDTDLHDIALTFALLSERHGPNCAENGETYFRITHRDNRCHEHSVTISMESDGPEGSEDWNELQTMTWEALQRSRGMDTFEDDVAEALRSFMRWIYGRLEDEYEYLTSDEQVDDMIGANEYVFDEDGRAI